MAKGNVALTIGVLTVIVAVGALTFIFWSMTDYAEKCKIVYTETCEVFTGASFPLLMIVLIIAALVLISSTVVYILVTA